MDQAPDLSIQDPNHPSDDEAKSLEKKPPKPIKSSLSSIILSLIMILFIFMGQKIYGHVHRALTDIQTRQLALSNQINTLEKTLIQIKVKQEDGAERISQTEEQLALVSKEALYHSNDWIIQKARYYLELAQINQQWMDDPASTIVLLKQADILLTPIHQSRLNPLREAIAGNIFELDKRPNLNTLPIIESLQALEQHIDSLAQSNNEQAVKPMIENLQAPKHQVWTENLKNSLSSLKRLVVIQHYAQDALQAKLLPKAQSILIETLRLNIQQAEIAVLNHRQALYQLSLETARQTIKNNFDRRLTATQTVLSSLDKLLDVQLELKAPPLTDLITLLDSINSDPKVSNLDTPNQDKR